jgi:hypothetical protein
MEQAFQEKILTDIIVEKQKNRKELTFFDKTDHKMSETNHWCGCVTLGRDGKIFFVNQCGRGIIHYGWIATQHKSSPK